MMAVAAWLVWRERGRVPVALPLALYFVQLALNAVWSVLFFGMHMPGIALLEIGALWAGLAVTTLCFARVRPLAAVLMLPYLAWVSFAAYLNFGFWRLNG
jgi:tryptophan-rich sensory protein